MKHETATRHILRLPAFLALLAFTAGAAAASSLDEASLVDGNCGSHGKLSVNVWALNQCGDGPCDDTSTYSVNLWVANEGCGRYSWYPCWSDVADSRAGCPADPVNWDVDTGRGSVSVWLLNT